MKKLVLILLALIMCTAFVGCNNQNENNEETKTKHTVPATDAINDELEWAGILCDLQLNDSSGQCVLLSNDFEMFALSGSTDTDSYITMKVTDDAAKMLKALPQSEQMTLLINNIEVAKITIDPKTFDGKFEFGHSDSFSQLCEYSNIIRGLY